ncbi:MAG: pentapeptide repeat-containing protein [Cyanobacteria bacterium P01_F01_bin.53]
MADAEHLELLKQGVEVWNQWRKDHREIQVDLTFAELQDLRLDGINLQGVNLEGANLESANLTHANLTQARLGGANLSNSRLNHAFLFRADLTHANLTEADLTEARLSHATLIRTRFIKTILVNADLTRASALEANFIESNLTGACIQEWNISASTTFSNVTCDYIFLQQENQNRRPSNSCIIFGPGEFVSLIQKSFDTIDLIFGDGIDWQAFFQSFQDLRSQYADQNLSIQAIERKRGGAFIVRLEVAEGADKSAIESSAKELYENQLKALETQHERQLRLQGEQHSEEIQRLIAAERQEKATLMGILTTMANNQGPKNDFRGAQFGGGFIETNQGTQSGGTINNYGSNAEDITRLLAALRDQAQTFPTDQQDEANDALDLLERDLKEEQPDQGRIGRRLKKLVALGVAIGTIASGAAAVSGDVSTFTGNVIELTEKLGIPVEQVQLPSSGTP